MIYCRPLVFSVLLRWLDVDVTVVAVVFVSVSFLVLMLISMAWLLFYYVQRFRFIRNKVIKLCVPGRGRRYSNTSFCNNYLFRFPSISGGIMKTCLNTVGANAS
jgi:hypothetical protein